MIESNEVEQVQEEQPQPYFFRMVSDQEGVSELTFQKNQDMVITTLLFLLDFVNTSLDKPYPATSDLILKLAESAKMLEDMQAGSIMGTLAQEADDGSSGTKH